MRKFLFALYLLSIANCLSAQDLKYYLPDSVSYNPAIPKPKDIIYHEVGEWHITHDRLVNFFPAQSLTAKLCVQRTLGYQHSATSPINSSMFFT